MRYNESLTFSPMPNTSTQKRSAPEAGVTLGATINSRPCFIYESDLQVGSLCICIDYPRVWMSRPSERCVLGIPLCRPDFGKTISGTDKKGHTHTNKENDTPHDERHSILIFDIFDVNLWFFFSGASQGCVVVRPRGRLI